MQRRAWTLWLLVEMNPCDESETNSILWCHPNREVAGEIRIRQLLNPGQWRAGCEGLGEWEWEKKVANVEKSLTCSRAQGLARLLDEVSSAPKAREKSHRM